jgi:hypothetical protein
MTARTDEDLDLFLDRERAAAYYNRYEKGFPVSDYEEFMRKYIDSWDRDVEHYPYSLPHNAMQFSTVEELTRAVTGSGSHFFCADSMRWWKSKVYDDLPGGRFFLTSERGPDETRVYSVRWVYDIDKSLQISRFDKWFDTLKQARTFAAIAAKAVIDHRKEMDL